MPRSYPLFPFALQCEDAPEPVLRRDPGRGAHFHAAESAQAPDEAGRLRAPRTREGMCLIEHQEVEPCIGEELDVLLPGKKQLELLDGIRSNIGRSVSRN